MTGTQQPKTTTTPPWQTPCQTLRDLRRINQLVKRETRAVFGIDLENLSSDIWTELWQKKLPVVRTFVRARVVDEIRKRIRRREVLVEDPSKVISPIQELSTDEEEKALARLETIGTLVARAGLSQTERTILYMKFYQALPSREIGIALGIGKRAVNDRVRVIMAKLRGAI